MMSFRLLVRDWAVVTRTTISENDRRLVHGNPDALYFSDYLVNRLPIERFRQILRRLRHARLDRFTHSRHGEEIDRFPDCAAIFIRGRACVASVKNFHKELFHVRAPFVKPFPREA